METKYNEATLNRPEGSRMIDGPVVFNDLVEVSEQLKTEKAWETNDLNGITVYKSEKTAMVLTIIKKGTRIKNTSIDGSFALLVLSGKLLVETEGENYHVETANMLNLQPRVNHSILAEKETVILQIACP